MLEGQDVAGEPWRTGRHLEMPVFNGECPKGWIFKAKHFCEMHRLSEMEKLMATGVSFEDEALAWYRWTDASTPFMSWEGLKRQLWGRFGSSQSGSLCGRFLSIKQMEIVAEYKRDFEIMSASMASLPDEVLEGTFVKGLKLEIQAEVRVLKPIGLGPLMEKAQLVEEKNLAIKGLSDLSGPKIKQPNTFKAQGGIKTRGFNYKHGLYGSLEGNMYGASPWNQICARQWLWGHEQLLFVEESI